VIIDRPVWLALAFPVRQKHLFVCQCSLLNVPLLEHQVEKALKDKLVLHELGQHISLFGVKQLCKTLFNLKNFRHGSSINSFLDSLMNLLLSLFLSLLFNFD
jgi:hypothetical protein